MDMFTPMDTIRALFAHLAACFPSRHNEEDDPELDDERGRRDELEGLLAEEDQDADILSLRSEGGRRRRRTGGRKKSMRMCGLDLFGRRSAADGLDPEQTADEDEQDEIFDRLRISRSPSPLAPPDSDAPSLTPSQIALLAKTRFQHAYPNPSSASGSAPPPPLRSPSIVPQDERDHEDLADALVRTSTTGFEGFPGSGNDDFGDFVHSPTLTVPRPTSGPVPQARDEEESADFGAIFARHSKSESYSSRPRSKGGSSSSGTPSLASHPSQGRSRARTKTKTTRSRPFSPPSETSATDSVRTPSDRQHEGDVFGDVSRPSGRVDGSFPSTGLSRVGGKSR